MQLENRFSVPAPPDEVSRLLNDVPRVVPCMPGAEFKEVVDDNRWKALMHVKLGPIALQFDVDVERRGLDDARRRVSLAISARELRGRGGAHAAIVSTLAEADRGTDVTIETELALRGAVAQYSRGIVADVASQLTEQFATCLAAQFVEPPEGSTTPGSTGGGAAGQPVKPIGGLRLTVRGLWRRLTAPLRRRSGG